MCVNEWLIAIFTFTETENMAAINNTDFNFDITSNAFYRTTDEIMVIIFCFLSLLPGKLVNVIREVL